MLAPDKKNIYKKSLAIELIKRGHDLDHTMRNRDNSKYQVFVFTFSDELVKDLLAITKQQRMTAQLDRQTQQYA